MRKRSIVFLALIAALVLSACGFGAASEPPAGAEDLLAPTDTSAAGGSTPTTGSAGNVTITFGAFSFMRHAYEPLIEAFNAQHAGITVQFASLDEVYQGNDDSNDRTRQIVSRADTAQVDAASEEQFNQGLLHDLTPLMDADPNFNRDDFYPSALSSATAASGAVYRLPHSLDVPLLFYNKDLWAARNLAAPEPDWTWQDIEAAAQQVAQKRGSTVEVYGLADDDVYLAVLLAKLKSAGLDLLTTPPASAHVDRPEVAAALEQMASLFTSGAFFFPPQGRDSRDTVVQLIRDQQVAMWGSRYAGEVASLQGRNGNPAPSFAVGVAPYPPFSSGGKGLSGGYIMSSGTQHPNEAWAWLSFLSTQIVADQSGKGGAPGGVSALPARKSLAEQSGYWSGLDDETKAAVQTVLARPAPASSNLDSLDNYKPLFQAMLDIMEGKPAAQAASEAQTAISNRVAQAQQTPTAAPDSVPVVVATPVPNVAPAGATTITFGIPLPKGEDQATRIVQQFNQSNQGVFVQLKDTFTGSDLMPAPEIAAQADCFASPLSLAQSELTATLDLQPLIDADSSFQLDDYPAALLTPYRQGGQLHGLPWGLNSRVLVYNKDLFEAAGLQPPAAGWTVDDFLNAAQRLTSGQGDNKQYGFVMPRSRSESVKFLVHLLGAATVQGSGDTLKPNFTDPKVVEAARKVIDLLKNETPHTRLDDYSSAGEPADVDPLVGDGRAGMWFAWGLYAYGQKRPSFTLGLVAPPLAQAVLDTDDVMISGLYISAQTDKQQACWTWLKHISASTSIFANVPARRSAAHSDALNQEQPGLATAYDAYAAALDRVGQLAPGGSGPEMLLIDYYWFYQALDQAMQGKDLEQELASAQALTEQYMACVRAGGRPEACNRQVDPDYQG
ncbi:MAG: ABC transporter substrate-binding protein [Roseiflexaceae bacterium]